MQAWTNVLVIDKTHARTGQAGVCQGPPVTKHGSTSKTAAEMDETATKAEDLVIASAERLARATADHEVLQAQAVQLRARANDADSDNAATDPESGELFIDVKFDADGTVESLPVAALSVLGG